MRSRSFRFGLDDVRAAFDLLGNVTIRETDGEYRVALRLQEGPRDARGRFIRTDEDSAYYTDDLQDAAGTGLTMAYEAGARMPIELSGSDDAEPADGGWWARLTAYAHPVLGWWDQSVGDGTWEIPNDMDAAYACIMLPITGSYDPNSNATWEAYDKAHDAFVAALETEGYAVTSIL